ncbi:aldehyde dehydrogenase family protein [Clavibacter michiganensis]|uniref:aldehyde dehydrogenase family protein n=1 Tax=Clavibacter michiganensis TaxID=28447 RepID=UPI001D0BCA40|nr:aldehyde dehydrogenase family protein [Clavibacter michiganensis]UDM21138.1 aldehyde dehydrogenase family protein [Clavibacter michiganensis subsp. michiganensis]
MTAGFGGLRALHGHGISLPAPALEGVVGSMSGLLQARGIRPDDRVALVSDDSPRTVIAWLALINSDVTVVLVDDVATASSSAVGAAWVVVTDRRGVRDRASDPARVVDVSDEVRAACRSRPDAGLDSLRVPVDLGRWFLREEALGVLTSGTSGTPVVVVKSGAEILENVRATIRAVGYGEGDVFMPLLPLRGQYGGSVVLTAIVAGGELVLTSRLRMGEAVRTVERHAVTAVDASPRVHEGLLSWIRAHPDALPGLASVRVWGVGGSPVGPGLLRDFRAAVGRPLIDGYGSTQLGNVAFSPDGGPGLEPVDTYRTRIAPVTDAHSHSDTDSDTGSETDAMAGRLLVRRTDGRPMAHGRLPDAGDGWADTGDYASVVDGRLRVHGRFGVTQRNGYLLDLAAMELRLLSHGVPAAAVAIEGEGEPRVWLFVEDELRRAVPFWRGIVEHVLPAEAQPNHIEVVGKLPRTAADKVGRDRVRAMARRLERGRAVRMSDGAAPADDAELLDHLILRARDRGDRLLDILTAAGDRASAETELESFLDVLVDAYVDAPPGAPGTGPDDDARAPVFVMLPSNAVLESFALFCIVPLIQGRRVVVRPARAIEDVFLAVVAEFADLLPGVEVDGSDRTPFLARARAAQADVVLSGRRSTADEVATTIGRARSLVFFGSGHNPVIVGPDADIARAAEEVVTARLHAWGQDCLAPDVVFVDRRVADAFSAALVESVTAGADRRSPLPPLLRRRTLSGALDYLARHADRVAHGGEPLWRRHTISPAVVRFDLDAFPGPEEHFAPIITVVEHDDVERVVELLLTTAPYPENAMGVTLYGVEDRHARALVGSYTVAVDRPLAGATRGYEPFGGAGASSGFVLSGGRRQNGPIHLPTALHGDRTTTPTGRIAP